MSEVFHPVQMPSSYGRRDRPELSADITLRAYEVYVALFGEQQAMVTGGCRGGFGIGEIVAFLYARTFPKAEWQQRFDEARRGVRIAP